jgi:hypothetical protein
LKYACKDCEGVDDDGATIAIAPAPVKLLPKSNATAGLLVHLVVLKFKVLVEPGKSNTSKIFLTDSHQLG